jgi:hypothetical protein
MTYSIESWLGGIGGVGGVGGVEEADSFCVQWIKRITRRSELSIVHEGWGEDRGEDRRDECAASLRGI